MSNSTRNSLSKPFKATLNRTPSRSTTGLLSSISVSQKARTGQRPAGISQAFSLRQFLKKGLFLLFMCSTSYIFGTVPAFGHYALYPHCIEHPRNDPYNCSVDSAIDNVRGVVQQGSFRVCNKGREKAWVALGYYSSGWRSKGWWSINRGDCATLVGEKDSRYYYVYAKTSSGAEWSSSSSASFCAPSGRFDYPQDSSCPDSRKAFMKADTGSYKTASDYVFNLR